MEGCAQAQPMSQGRRRSPLPTDWPRRRARILKRDPDCQLRYDGCTTTSTEVDHIDQDDDHTDTNLRGVCHPCHAQRTERQRLDSLGIGPSRRRPKPNHPGLLDG